MENNITVNEIQEYFAITGKPDFVVVLAHGQSVKPENADRFIEGSVATALQNSDSKTHDVYFDALVCYYAKVKEARRILSGQK